MIDTLPWRGHTRCANALDESLEHGHVYRIMTDVAKLYLVIRPKAIPSHILGLTWTYNADPSGSDAVHIRLVHDKDKE